MTIPTLRMPSTGMLVTTPTQQQEKTAAESGQQQQVRKDGLALRMGQDMVNISAQGRILAKAAPTATLAAAQQEQADAGDKPLGAGMQQPVAQPEASASSQGNSIYSGQLLRKKEEIEEKEEEKSTEDTVQEQIDKLTEEMEEVQKEIQELMASGTATEEKAMKLKQLQTQLENLQTQIMELTDQRDQ